MKFDFHRFSRIAARVYNDSNLYSLQDCLSVFKHYFEAYEEFTGRVHPPIRASQIARIMQDMPYMDSAPSKELFEEIKKIAPQWEPSPDFTPDLYPLIIRRHFETKYRHCDYNINHFFSGKIRELRFCETCY